jgi:N-acetyl-anhydromuramoyl-L-alanine amidase
MLASLILKDGWIKGAVRVPSENYDERPAADVPELLVIHSISLPPGEYGGGEICNFFQNRLDCSAHPYFDGIQHLQVSSHFLIERTGRLVQFVSTEHRAWHAGESEYYGRTTVNNFSIGIELEGMDDDVFESEQYTALTALSRTLIEAYPKIGSDAVTGHSDIAPGRKTDPGTGFDWIRYKESISNL